MLLRKINQVNGIERGTTLAILERVIRKGRVFKRLMFEQRGSEGSSAIGQNVASRGLTKCKDFI